MGAERAWATDQNKRKGNGTERGSGEVGRSRFRRDGRRGVAGRLPRVIISII